MANGHRGHEQEVGSLMVLTYEVSQLGYFLKRMAFSVYDVMVLHWKFIDVEEITAQNCRLKRNGSVMSLSKITYIPH